MSKYKVQPMSKAWKDELKSLNTLMDKPDGIYDNIRNYSAILHTGEVLIDVFGKKKRSYVRAKPIELISYYYFAHCYHLGYSVYHLVKMGYGSASVILLRSIIESTIDLSYLWLCKEVNNSEEERNAWMQHSCIRRDTMSRMWNDMQLHRKNKGFSAIDPIELIKNENADILRVQASDFKKKYCRDHWAKITSLDKRARAVDDTNVLNKQVGISLEEIYNMCYRWSSELVHAESASAGSYIDDTSNRFYVDFGPSFKNVDTVIPITSRVMLGLLYIINHINHLNIDIMAQCESSGFSIKQT